MPLYNRIEDGKGFYCLPGIIGGFPVKAKSQKLTNATADTDGTITVTSGKVYRVTALKTGGVYLGIAAVTTAANVLWPCPLGATILIHVDPVLVGVQKDGNVTLHYAVDTNSAIGYLVELAE